jgi:peptidoglycan/LPS O-acetylase OafA/YrhL
LPPRAYFSNTQLAGYVFKTLTLSTGSAPLPGVFGDLPIANGVNTSLWTLKYEVLCYAALAFAGLAGLFSARHRNAGALVLAVFLATVFSAEPADPETYVFADNMRYFALYFGTGVLLYLLRDRLIINGAVLIPLFVIFVSALQTRFAELSTALLLGYAVVWAAKLTFGPLRAVCNRIDLSFGVYIYAGPIEQALVSFAPSIHPLAIAALAAFVVLPLALLSWVFIEFPALRLRTRLRPGVRGRSEQRLTPGLVLHPV